MNPSESWKSLEIDAADEPPMPPPDSGCHIVAFVATPTVRSGGWAARASLEIARGWGAAGARIVLADLSLEEPVLHDAAGLDNLEGVSDALLFGTSFQRLGQPLSDGLYLVTAGTAVPDGEALRSHPRWRDFVDGFRQAEAVLALYTPVDAPGGDVLLGMADCVVVLCTEGEAGDLEVPGDVPVLALRGPEGVDESDLAGEATPAAPAEPMHGDAEPVPTEPTAESALQEPEEPGAGASEAEGAEQSGVREMDPVDPQESQGADAAEAVGDFLEELDVIPVDPGALVASAPDATDESRELTDGSSELMDDAGPAAGASGADDGEGHEAAELHDPMMDSAVDPLAPAPEPGMPPPTLDEILEDEALGAGSGDASPQVEQGTPVVTRPRSRESRSGARPVLMIVVVLALAAVLVAAFLGLIEIPGITPESAGIEEAGAAEVVRDRGGAGPVDRAVASTAAPSGGPGEAGADAGDGETFPILDAALALGSFSSLQSAADRRRSIQLSAPSVPLIVAPVEVDGESFYRLLAAPAGTDAGLEALRGSLAQALGPLEGSTVRSARLAFLLGTASRLGLAERQRDVLARIGIPAHILRVGDGEGGDRYRVYAGAFANPLEARLLAALLEENGIDDAQLTEHRGVWPE